MTKGQIGLLVVAPMIVGTALLLARQGALGLKGVALVTLATLAVASFLFFNQ